jgi:Ca-activated chloride channel family protein
MEGYGGTELLPALQRAMQVPKMQGYARSFVIITDGYVMVEEAAFRMVRENLDRANFFAFGIGSSVNRHLIEGLAHVGRGEPFIVTEDKEAKKTAAQFKSYIEHPILTDIRVTSNGVTLSELIPEHIPDLLAARPVYFTGKFSGNEVASLTVSGRQGSTPFTTTITLPVPRLENAALPYLWAREKIRLLDDFNAVSHSAERVREITNLGLKYNLLTKYTAFVAVDHEIVNETGEQKRVNQPLPLPESVSDYAIGFEMEFEEVGGGEPVLFTVDVQCDDRDIKLFVESVLELAMDTLTHADMLAFAGQTVEVFIDGPGGHIQVGGSGTLNVFVRTAIQGAFAKLGFPVRGRHKVMISVTSTGH